MIIYPQKVRVVMYDDLDDLEKRICATIENLGWRGEGENRRVGQRKN